MMFQIEVTTHCSYQCFYCAGRGMPQRHMAWETFEAIVARLPSGPHVVSLQGEGEPTLHPRFWEMAEQVRQRGWVPTTITNGYQVDVAKLASHFPTLGISIDTVDPDEADRIGRFKLPKVLATLDQLLIAMGPDRLRVHTTDYGQDVAAVRQYLKARRVEAHIVQPLQGKADYAARYAVPDAPTGPDRYHYACRYLQRPEMRYFNIDGTEMPCCFIKDTSRFTSTADVTASLANARVPPSCEGCREISRPDTEPAAPWLSFIVTCKGRLSHLQQSLPTLLAQPWSETIVVDYACPDGTAAWVRAQAPRARVVSVSPAEAREFRLADARNRGAAIARGEWLCFVDADVRLSPEFAEAMMAIVSEKSFCSPTAGQPELDGTFLCSRTAFEQAGRYDEAMTGWGVEDHDLYFRLHAAGYARKTFPSSLLNPIHHDDALRVRFYDIADRQTWQRLNCFYCNIKYAIARMTGQSTLPLPLRQQLYDEVRRQVSGTVHQPGRPTRIEVTLPPGSALPLVRGWQINRKMVFELEPQLPDGGQAMVQGSAHREAFI